MGLLTLLRSSDLGNLALLVLALQFGAGFATFAVVTALALGPADAARERWALHLRRRSDTAGVEGRRSGRDQDLCRRTSCAPSEGQGPDATIEAGG